MWQLEQMSLTYFEVLKRASSFLTKNNQSAFAAEWLMRERLAWTKTDLIKNFRKSMPEEEKLQFEADMNQFLQGKPMQQIIGHDWFLDRKFLVTKDTLIPRPETEEWLDRLLNILPKRSLKVLDMGTGTGVLAISQKLERPQDEITAVDISAEALSVAKENGARLHADINWVQSDLFQQLTGQTFDLIISNPPYISYEEVDLMDESVLSYEPATALFAKNDGLAIYEELAANISHYLKDDYIIALEIGYAQGDAVSNLFKQALPHAHIEVWTDFNELSRVVLITGENVDKTVDRCG